MNPTELIARLRNAVTGDAFPYLSTATLLAEAADALSRVEAELAALKAEKLEREGQEPDAWYADFMGANENDVHLTKRSDWGCKWRPLYLAPGAGSVPMTDAVTYLHTFSGAASRDWIAGWNACVKHHGVKP